MTRGEDYLVDHHIRIFVFDPDVCQSPVILVGPSDIIFKIDGFRVFKQIFQKFGGDPSFFRIPAFIFRDRFRGIDTCETDPQSLIVRIVDDYRVTVNNAL